MMPNARRAALVVAGALFLAGCAGNPLRNPYPATGMFMTDGPSATKERATRSAGGADVPALEPLRNQ